MDAVLAHNIDGVIVAPCAGGEAAIRKATDSGVPVVLLDRDIDSIEMSERFSSTTVRRERWRQSSSSSRDTGR